MSYSALLRAAVTACREEIARGSRRRSMAPGAWHEGAVTGVCRGASIAVHGRCSAGPGEIAERAGAARPAIGRGGAQGAVGRRRDRAAEKTRARPRPGARQRRPRRHPGGDSRGPRGRCAGQLRRDHGGRGLPCQIYYYVRSPYHLP